MRWLEGPTPHSACPLKFESPQQTFNIKNVYFCAFRKKLHSSDSKATLFLPWKHPHNLKEKGISLNCLYFSSYLIISIP